MRAREKKTSDGDVEERPLSTEGKEGKTVYIWVHFRDPVERASICALLRTWMELSCVTMDIIAAAPIGGACPPAILFWDLDSPE